MVKLDVSKSVVKHDKQYDGLLKLINGLENKVLPLSQKVSHRTLKETSSMQMKISINCQEKLTEETHSKDAETFVWKKKKEDNMEY